MSGKNIKMILKMDNASPQKYGKRLPLSFKMRIVGGCTLAYNVKTNTKTAQKEVC